MIEAKLSKGMKARRTVTNTVVYLILIVMSIIWLIPIVWVVFNSFRAEGGSVTGYFFPKGYTLQNYVRLFTDPNYKFIQWFLNTLLVSVCSCVLTSFITLSTAYVMSRFRFKSRQPLMKLALILGMFPGFMSMIAVYYILKAVDMTQSLLALILVYSASAGLGFYISKGFFDTVPKVLDEAARIDGASNARIFFTLVLPLSKPIIVYTALMAFMAPWMDFIFARIIMGSAYDKYTVAVGLWYLLDKENIERYFTMFTAGAVFVALPITIVFMCLQRYYVEGITGGSVKG